MKFSPALTAELVELVSQRTRRARVAIIGTSMQPLLRAGMVVDIAPLTESPRIGDILVFRSDNGLVAHRLVGGELLRRGAHDAFVADRLVDERTGAFVTAGDAQPNRTEIVPRHFVIGRVSAVWTSEAPDAQRVDNRQYHRLGWIFARTRPLRSFARRARAYGGVVFSLLFTGTERIVPPPAYSALIAATRCFERGRYAQGVAFLRSVPASSAIEVSRRHHASGLIARWLEEASHAGEDVPDELRGAFRRIRWTNALQAGRVLACARDVRDRFAAAGIPHIFLKGGARLAAGAPDADVQFSGDLDVIVPGETAERALSALRDAGYRDTTSEKWRSSHSTWLHHREPLVLPGSGIPVEVHITLAPVASVSQRLDHAALVPSSRRVNGSLGDVHVLDDVASAVHLAYHARDLHVWRDIVLLSRLLRSFDSAARARFDAYVQAEKKDGLRLASAVAAADAIAFDTPRAPRGVRRYLAWSEFRENLPRRFGYPELLEAVFGRCPMRGLRLDSRRNLGPWMRCWIRNLVLLPVLMRIAWSSRLR